MTNKSDPTLKTGKSKIQMLQAYAPAMRRNPSEEDQTETIQPDGETGTCSVGEKFVDGSTSTSMCKVHPLAVAYMEEDETHRGKFDIHAAVSLDEGATWKRINLSNNVKRQSEYNGRICFSKDDEGHDHDGDDEGVDGVERRLQDDHDGGSQTPFTIQGDNFKPMIVAKGDKILVAWTSKNCKGGVPGNQGEGDGPFMYNFGDPENKLERSDRDASDRSLVKGAQWCHANFPDVGNVPFSCVWAARGKVEGDGTIVWTKPERFTSGRRDAFQLVAAGHSKAWALAWQEDPRGLRVGEAEGPGDGMSGATVNHKTDIWYSYLEGSKFWDVDGPDEGSSRMNIVTRFSEPVRVTDNAACKVEHDVDENGDPARDDDGDILVRDVEGKPIFKGAPYCKDLCDIEDLYEDPNPQAKYPLSCKAGNIPLNGDTGASRPNMFLIEDPDPDSIRVVLAYEESKGLGKGPGEGHRRLQDEPAEREDWGKNIYYHTFFYDKPDEIAHGTMINLPELTESNEPAAVTEDGTEFFTKNARRVRMIVQPPKNMGDEQLAMALLYREGDEGHGHPAHIIMRRFTGGYTTEHLECTKTRKHPYTKEDVCVEGSIDVNEDNTPDPDAEYDNARAHRGFLRGDFLVVGYTYTDKWGRGNPDRHDFFVRRSFDGGKKWTNANGIKEDPVNLSNIKEPGEAPQSWSVMEPRLYATPGTIGKQPKLSDVQNSAVYYVAYSTTHQPEHGDENMETDDGKDKPRDLLWTMTDNYGESYMKVLNDNVSPPKWQYPRLAKVHGVEDDAGFAGAQIRTNPAGTKIFASFQADVNSVGALEGGGPCRGNGVGSDVCSNTTVVGDTLVLKYDLDGKGKVDSDDEKCLQIAIDGDIADENCDSDRDYDLNGDGIVDGQDLKLFRRVVGEYQKRTDLGVGRRTYLRHRQ